MIESEKLQVSELRNQGFSDMQLNELGYSAASVTRAPSVLLKKWKIKVRNERVEYYLYYISKGAKNESIWNIRQHRINCYSMTELLSDT